MPQHHRQSLYDIPSQHCNKDGTESGLGEIHTDFHADLSCNGPTTNDSDTSAAGVAQNSTQSHPPVVLAGRHGDGCDLAAVAPLPQEGHDKGLNPRRAQEKRQEIVESLEEVDQATPARRGATTVGRT